MIEVVVEANGERHLLTVDRANAMPANQQTLPGAMVPLLLAELVDLGRVPPTPQPAC
jgi:hypothetical protein